MSWTFSRLLHRYYSSDSWCLPLSPLNSGCQEQTLICKFQILIQITGPAIDLYLQIAYRTFLSLKGHVDWNVDDSRLFWWRNLQILSFLVCNIRILRGKVLLFVTDLSPLKELGPLETATHSLTPSETA